MLVVESRMGLSQGETDWDGKDGRRGCLALRLLRAVLLAACCLVLAARAGRGGAGWLDGWLLGWLLGCCTELGTLWSRLGTYLGTTRRGRWAARCQCAARSLLVSLALPGCLLAAAVPFLPCVLFGVRADGWDVWRDVVRQEGVAWGDLGGGRGCCVAFTLLGWGGFGAGGRASGRCSLGSDWPAMGWAAREPA